MRKYAVIGRLDHEIRHCLIFTDDSGQVIKITPRVGEDHYHEIVNHYFWPDDNSSLVCDGESVFVVNEKIENSWSVYRVVQIETVTRQIA